jgi:hypothetical protein
VEQVARLAFRVPVERKRQDVVKGEVGHPFVRVLHHRGPECITEGGEATRGRKEAESDIGNKVGPGVDPNDGKGATSGCQK